MSRTHPTTSSIVEYLAQFRHYYPGILEWYSGVESGLASGRRRIFASWSGPTVMGLAITKNGPKAKLCHISVSPKVRERGIGRDLMRLALRDMMRSGARQIRVTTGEEVFRHHALFFLAAGFDVIDWQLHRYRRGTSELLWQLEVDATGGNLSDRWTRRRCGDGEPSASKWAAVTSTGG